MPRDRKTSSDLCGVIINKFKQLGGNEIDGTIPRGVLARVTSSLGINKNTAKSVWHDYCRTGNVCRPRQHGGGWKKLSNEQERYVDYLVTETPSLSLGGYSATDRTNV